MPPLNSLENNSKEEVNASQPLQENIDLASHGFHSMGCLGGGQFGQVTLYRYLGNDPVYLSMCYRGMIALKTMDNAERELAAAKTIHQYSASGKLDTSAINKTYPLQINGQFIGMLTTYESYSDIKGDQVVEFSRNLYDVVQDTFHPRYNHQTTGTAITAALKGNPAIFLSQMACGIVKGQDTLHQMSMLHQDSAARNFLIRTQKDESGNVIGILPKISDYGLSSVLSEGEEHGTYPSSQAPLLTIDSNTFYSNGSTSILTDYHARKVSMITVISAMLAELPREGFIISLKPGEQQSNAEFMLSRINEFSNDSAALKQYLLNLNLYIKGCKDEHLKQEIELFMDCYEPWLTFSPNQNDLKKARKEEKTLFEYCSNRFIQMYHEHMMKNKSKLSGEDYLLGLQRLSQIEVAAPDPVTKRMIEGQIRQMGKPVPPHNQPVATTTPSGSYAPTPARTENQARGGSQHTASHYERTPFEISQPPLSEESDEETPYSGIVSEELLKANRLTQETNRSPSNQTQDSHYTNMAQHAPHVPQPEKQTNPSSSPYGKMPSIEDAPNPQPPARSHSDYGHVIENKPQENKSNYDAVIGKKSQEKNSNYDAVIGKKPQENNSNYDAVIGKKPQEKNSNYDAVIGKKPQEKNTQPSTTHLQNGPEVTQQWKKALPQEWQKTVPQELHHATENQPNTPTKQANTAHHATRKAAIKALWTEFTAEIEQQLAKLSPKDNVDELAEKFKALLKDAQNSIKTLLQHNKPDYHFPKSKDEDDDGDHETYHP